jgi:hypothetical protein
MSRNELLPAPELSRQLLAALRDWQLYPANQQDDFTLVMIDVL